MQLSKKAIGQIKKEDTLSVPAMNLLELPEKVLQFGTGVLLRGLPDYFIDKANKQGFFNGRVVVVKSTSTGGTDAFETQDGLFTLSVKGIEDSKKVEETIINASISRVLSAKEQWAEILKCASNPDMQLIISNTTEVGIVLTDDDIRQSPPSSFPGKLLAFLHERYRVFNGSLESGMVIVPTELIVGNGTKLREIVLELAEQNKLEKPFIQWLASANHFCNSLVDRIVPGKLPAIEQKDAENRLGYSDELMIMAEPFRLWAIESGSDRVKEVLSFAQSDKGVVVTPDIEKFRELKLRLLNGTHTFSSGIAVLAGFPTVKEAMVNEEFSAYVRRLMMLEIANAVASDTISYNEACAFANTVIDRFRNPFIEHQWLAITMNFSSKMRMRNIPLLTRHYEKNSKVPAHMAQGFAAYLLFMKCVKGDDGAYYGTAAGKQYKLQDDQAGYFAGKWAALDTPELVKSVLADKEIWGIDLTEFAGFAQAVTDNIEFIKSEGALAMIANGQLSKSNRLA
ncbi:tagaturonate reductase [Terrimonas sp. NA20]|uniref:Tagaturonate reductase n=1 Tax=Terrimonas ginsenosidimutans TaxID=2908004 RepID=A0ABS9KNE8_9BACT|nr:tagaturonate reductase [Terrimonas ginsenosidimutans]MCG2613840.1 tagaturonate reductase [Terrimonas ginsenosidimutans]